MYRIKSVLSYNHGSQHKYNNAITFYDDKNFPFK